ncbi:TPA: DUF262 domain-containing protein, partial [Escherichia coli]|nr:DUF262 domain-containing protein [Escherichia coli]
NCINKLFGKKAFRILNENLEPQVRNFNSALFDALIVGFMVSKFNQDMINELDGTKLKDFLIEFQIITSEERFNESITSGTSATQSVHYRISTMKNFIERYFN